MITLKLTFITHAHHPQHRSDGPFSRREDRAYNQNLHLIPGPFTENWRKGLHQDYDFNGQVEHCHLFVVIEVSLACPPFFVY